MESIDQTLLASFLEEARELLEEIEMKLLEVEKSPRDTGLINELFRAFHTLKGSSGMVGMITFQNIAHEFENLLDALRKKEIVVTRDLVTLFFKGADALKELALYMAKNSCEPPLDHWMGLLEEIKANTRERNLAGEDDSSGQEDGAQTSGFNGLYLLPITFRLDILRNMLAGGNQGSKNEGGLYILEVNCETGIFARGLDPLRLALQGVETIGGQVVSLTALGDRLPPVDEFDPEKCYLPFLLAFKAPSNKIETLLFELEFLADDADIKLGQIKSILDLFSPDLVELQPLSGEERQTLRTLAAEPSWKEPDERLEYQIDNFIAAALKMHRLPYSRKSIFCEAVLLVALLRGIFNNKKAINRLLEDFSTLLLDYATTDYPDIAELIAPREVARDIWEYFSPPPSNPSGDEPISADQAATVISPSLNLKGESIRVDRHKIEHLMDLASELILQKNSLEYWLKSLQKIVRDHEFFYALKEQEQALTAVIRELQETIISLRMTPLRHLFSRFPRYVRDMALKLGKEVELTFRGEETELDRETVERLYEPLLHLVRNALDHGLESPGERQVKGKESKGHITIRASREASVVVIEVIDDGRGIDVDKIKFKAVQKGLISQEEAAKMNERDAMKLIFMPGFSTAERVTEVSGRGVGMDAVQHTIVELGGYVNLHSISGKGTTVRVVLPLSLLTTQVLVVEDCGEEIGIPVGDIERIVEAEEILHYSIQETITHIEGRALIIKDLGSILGAAGTRTKLPERKAIVLREGVCLLAERILATEDLVVRRLTGELADLNLYLGAAIKGNGKVIMILNTHSLKGAKNL